MFFSIVGASGWTNAYLAGLIRKHIFAVGIMFIHRKLHSSYSDLYGRDSSPCSDLV